jgi:signal transduction histidine kinase
VFISAGLTHVSDIGWRALAERLLPAARATDPAARLPRVIPPLRVTVAVALALELLCVLLWGLTGRTSPWPAWVALGLLVPVGVQASFAARALVPWPRWRDWATAAGVSAVAFVVCLGAWVIPGGDYFWPIWPLLGMTTALSVKALITYGARSERRVMAPRMEQLRRTRAGVVDASDDELSRIERDLHDGAQARLVAMSMSLGLAEERLDRDPEGARELMVEAQEQARTAIRELRDLARGIAPPVLADRGLQAAIEALAASSPLPVHVTGAAGERPGPSVERAAYFVAAEALANAAKHAGASRIVVTLARTGDGLLVEVADDGRGGADPNGSGLAGLRRRVEALDGRLEVTTPAAGAGTIIRASLPCASS